MDTLSWLIYAVHPPLIIRAAVMQLNGIE